jgi:hypothetical protein
MIQYESVVIQYEPLIPYEIINLAPLIILDTPRRHSILWSVGNNQLINIKIAFIK